MKRASIVAVFAVTIFVSGLPDKQAGIRASAADDRRGHFSKSSMLMVVCPAGVLSKRHPEMHFMVGMAEGGGYSTTAATSDDMSTALWVITAKDAASGSDVTLQSKGGSAAQLDEAWAAVEYCQSDS